MTRDYYSTILFYYSTIFFLRDATDQLNEVSERTSDSEAMVEGGPMLTRNRGSFFFFLSREGR